MSDFDRLHQLIMEAEPTNRVTLVFELDEEVSPPSFVRKVAMACSSGTLRPGESVSTEDGEVKFTIEDKPLLDDPMFDFLKRDDGDSCKHIDPPGEECPFCGAKPR